MGSPPLVRRKMFAAASVALLMVAVVFLDGSVRILGFELDAVSLGIPLALIATLPALASGLWREIPWRFVGVGGAAFLLMALASALVNSDVAAALPTFARYCSYLALMLAVGALTSDVAMRKALLWTLVLAGAGTLAYAAFQYVNPIATAGMEGLPGSVATRIVGTFHNANFYGEYLVLLIGAGLSVCVRSAGTGRAVSGFIVLAASAALVLTYTRGSWLALAVAVIIAVALLNWRLLVAFIPSMVVLVLAVPNISQRLLTLTQSTGSHVFRLHLWQIAGASIAERPWLGVGLGSYDEAYRSVVLWTRPDLWMGYLNYGLHNSYITLAVEIGIIGAAAFLFMTVFQATRGVFAATRAGIVGVERLEALCLGIGPMAFVLNSITSNSFQHPQGVVFYWISAGLLAGAVSQWLERPAAVRGQLAPPRQPSYGSAVVHVLSIARCFFLGAWTASGIRQLLCRRRPLGR